MQQQRIHKIPVALFHIIRRHALLNHLIFMSVLQMIKGKTDAFLIGRQGLSVHKNAILIQFDHILFRTQSICVLPVYPGHGTALCIKCIDRNIIGNTQITRPIYCRHMQICGLT